MKRLILAGLLAFAAVYAGAQGTSVVGANNVVAVVKPTLAASQTTSIGPTTFYTIPTAGVYRFTGYIDVTVVGSAGTYLANVVFTSDGHSFTIAPLGSTVSATVQWTNTMGTGNNSSDTFYADAGTVVQYQIVATGVTGTPTIRYAFQLERIQ